MRRLRFAGGVGLLFGLATTLWAQQSAVFHGSATGQQIKFKQIDTNKTIAPVPSYGQSAKSPFSLKSLLPGWLRSNDTTPQPTTMRALKHATAPSPNTSSSGAFQPTQPFAQQK